MMQNPQAQQMMMMQLMLQTLDRPEVKKEVVAKIKADLPRIAAQNPVLAESLSKMSEEELVARAKMEMMQTVQARLGGGIPGGNMPMPGMGGRGVPMPGMGGRGMPGGARPPLGPGAGQVLGSDRPGSDRPGLVPTDGRPPPWNLRAFFFHLTLP